MHADLRKYTKAELIEMVEDYRSRLDPSDEPTLKRAPPEPPLADTRLRNTRRIAAAADSIAKAVREGCADLDRFLQVEGDPPTPHPATAGFRRVAGEFHQLIQRTMHPPVKPEGNK